MRKFPRKRKVFHLILAIMVLTFSLPRVASSQASTSTSSQVVPIAQLAFVPCANDGAGELVSISGNLHILSHFTFNHPRLIVKSHSQPQGVKGVGQITGDVYHGTGVTQSINTILLSTLASGAETFTLINNFGLIAPGTDNNFRVHENLHITINANGEFISSSNISVDCG